MRVGAVRVLRTKIAQVGVGVGLVHHQALDQGGEGRDDGSAAALGDRCQHFGFDLEVPGIVGLVELKQGSCRRLGRSAALEDHFTEVGKTGLDAPVVRIEPVEDGAVRAEVGHDVGTRADGAEVLVGAAGRCLAQAVGKLRGLQDRAQAGHERVIGE